MDVIAIEGKEIKPDQVYHGFCCAGFDWTVAVVFPHAESVWGVCCNPECPDYLEELGDDDYYRGVSFWEPHEFLEMVESGQSRFPARTCANCGEAELDPAGFCWHCQHENEAAP